MTRQRRARSSGAGALAVAGALILSGCGGSSFDEPADGGGDGELTSSDDALTLLIGIQRRRRDGCRQDAVAAWSEESGVEAEVKVATDLHSGALAGFRCG